MSEENKPYLIISKECDEIQINIKHTKPYMKLQQENQQLKNDNAVMKAGLIQVSDKQRDLYKSVIEEVRERLEYYLIGNMKYEDGQKEFKKLLQILDKAKETIK